MITLLVGLLLVSSVGAIIAEDEVGVTVRVDGGAEECFFHRLLKETYGALEINYMVLKGGDLDINFSLRGPSGQIIGQDERKMNGRHSVSISDHQRDLGDYIMCMDNKYSSTPKTVALHLYTLDKEGNFIADLQNLDASNANQLEARVEFFETSTGRIRSNLNRMESEQQTVRHLEYIDRSIAEGTFEMVNFWATVNSVVILFAAFTQVFLIRSILTDDSRVGRLLRKGKMND